MITPNEAYHKLQELVELSKADPEPAHSKADNVMCDLLTSLGYKDIVDVYRKVEKWYA